MKKSAKVKVEKFVKELFGHKAISKKEYGLLTTVVEIVCSEISLKL